MTAITRKICIIGDFAVGKTSTVARYVHNVFSEKYLTTVGVKIDTKDVELAGEKDPVKLVIWDIAGSDRFSAVEFSYLRGSSGFLLVIDGTRANTLAAARRLREEAVDRYGELPLVTLVNKPDLIDEWEVTEADFAALEADGFNPLRTSAKTGDNVEKALVMLARKVTE